MSGVIRDNFLKVLNPISGKEISSIEVSSKECIDDILEKSQLYTTWENLNLDKRCDIINKFRKIIVSNRDSIEKTLKSETEKIDNDIFIEILTSLEHLKEIVKIARDGLKKERRNTGIMKLKKAFVKYEPIGVVGIISPWNYPIATPLSACVEALLAGNNVVLKPSEHTPLTMLHIKELWDKYIGFKDAFNIIIGGSEAGNQLVVSNKTDLICFTGSSRVGRSIAEVCGKMLKPVILELGGKDPMIILKEANLDRAVDAALFGGLSNAGQTCISTEEVYIDNEIFNIFVDKVTKKIEKLSSGSSPKDNLGAMIMPSNTQKVKEHIDEVKDSCEIISGTSSTLDMFIPPTIVIKPPDDSRLSKEETFGPIISVNSFDNDKELIKKINDKGYGLSASIFGDNNYRTQLIASKIKTGNISINDVLTHYGIASLPFGGVGFSGIGKIHGIEGLRSFCRVKSYTINRFNWFNDPWWFNRRENLYNFIKKTINFIYKS